MQHGQPSLFQMPSPFGSTLLGQASLLRHGSRLPIEVEFESSDAEAFDAFMNDHLPASSLQDEVAAAAAVASVVC